MDSFTPAQIQAKGFFDWGTDAGSGVTDDEKKKTWCEVAEQCQCRPDELEDVYPCTALQEGMMALTFKNPAAYTVEYEYALPANLDPARFQAAWAHAIEANPILRTRIVPTRQRGCVQAVVRGSVPWRVNLNGPAQDDDGCAWRVGGPLVQFQLERTAVPNGDSSKYTYTLTLRMHHSLCDDWSTALLLHQVQAAYDDNDGAPLAKRPFRPLIEYIVRTRERTHAFWSARFRDAHQGDMKGFPSLPAPEWVPQPTQTQRCVMSLPASSEFTLGTKLALAWAVVQSLYTGSADTLFGTIQAGREVPVSGIETLTGPTLVCVPIRIILAADDTVATLLDAVKVQWAEAMEFEHVGLQYLRHLGQGPAAACQFQTLLAVDHAHDTPSLFADSREVQKSYDTYSLILQCRPSHASLTVEARFDPAVLDEGQVDRMLHQFAHICLQIDTAQTQRLRDIDTLSPRDHEALKCWNLPIPAAASRTVHDLIHDQVLRQPSAPAIHAWDGELTYASLDTISSAVAASLIRHGLKPRTFVPVCVEKSKWMAVALLAVMKAHAAFILLEPSYPIPRLQAICGRVHAPFILTSTAQAGVAAQLAEDVFTVDDRPPNKQHFEPSAIVSPTDPIYGTFTSGSTGTPKGVIVHHDGFASSALSHGQLYGLTPKSRVLQFASPAFDSCIIEHLTTLIMGGCVCVPRAVDCQSSLPDAIDRFSVNIACLTPALARCLSPGRLSTLDAVVLVGETVRTRDVAQWQPHAHVRNAYGPAECSAVFSVQPNLQRNDPANIGFPTGGVGWVVHPEHHDQLLPVGCPGELVIEGPIVGQGYLGDPETSARSFIQAPSWRHQFGSANGRMYKTGDLVQQVSDGSFRCLGRKDTQVKLHGQRIEFEDVEHHLRSLFPSAQHVAAEVLRPRDVLVAFVCLRNGPESVATTNGETEELFVPINEEFRRQCTIATEKLSHALPLFMVPRAFLAVARMPLTASGKLNRRRLRECAASLTWEELQTYQKAPSPARGPSSERETLLQELCAQILGRSPEDIQVTQSFTRLGGDSVSAMQLATSCHAAGFNVTIKDLFQSSTLAQVAETMQPSSSGGIIIGPDDDPTDKWFDLSPIQRLFFEHAPRGHDRFTQQFLLRVAQPRAATEIRRAIQVIVDRHSMLRAYFRQQPPDGPWQQAVHPKGNERHVVEEYSLPSIDPDSLKEILSHSQAALDIREGILLAVNLISTPGKQYLSVMVHHLVIDLVSWRVILQDLEQILTAGEIPGPPSLSFQRWCHLQQEYSCEALDPRTALPGFIPSPPLDYWGSAARLPGNTWGQTVNRSICLTKETTAAILGACNDALRTRPVEIIHAAILHAFVQEFSDRPAPTIFIEGHGREPWDAQLDISQTVGWFTTMVPIYVSAEKDQDITQLLRLVKDGRRAVPSSGWAYFTSRHLHPEGAKYCQNHTPMEILFNYTGLFQQLERPDAMLQLATLPDHDALPLPPELPRFALIDMSATVMDGHLHLSVWYNRQMKHLSRLEQWVELCQKTLEWLPSTLRELQRFTISDFPLLSFTSDERLQNHIRQISDTYHISPKEIEDIYPCSPVQLGMWLSQLQNPDVYWSQMQWCVHPTSTSEPVSLDRVKHAWQQVVDRHSMLRTIFAITASHQSQPLQVVLKSSKADIETVSGVGTRKNAPPGRIGDSGQARKTRPPHCLALAVHSNGRITCELAIHHMLIDGITRQVILSDFQRAYDEQLPSTPGVPYSSFVNYLHRMDKTETDLYWSQYLGGVHPCLFPRLPTAQVNRDTVKSTPISIEVGRDMDDFCRHHNISISNFFQVAWGLVLQAYTGSDSVCFGYLTSGREITLQDSYEIAGPLMNLLVCRLSLISETSVIPTLVENQAAYAWSLDHQHCALADVLHSINLPGQTLFNTTMSIQKDLEIVQLNDRSAIYVEPTGGYDATEYDLTINLAMGKGAVHGDLTYWTHTMSAAQAELVADSFKQAIKQILSPATTRLRQIDLVGPRHMDLLLTLNRHLPPPVVSCLHKRIRENSLSHPSAPAVAAWDGCITYKELDQSSSSLSQILVQRGVGSDIFVPIYSDKSQWTVVAALAVLKAGGAFILLDPSHPLQRLQDMLHRDFEISLVLAQTQYLYQAMQLTNRVLLIDDPAEAWHQAVRPDRLVRMPDVSPSTAAYAIFTSGSTGRPKAVVIEHHSFLSAAIAHSPMLGLERESRVLQFGSHAFDATIVEMFSTLLAGGCVCIPSESDRRLRLGDAIQDFQVNWALLTPSVARVLDPANVPSLKTLVLGGEGMDRDDVKRWAPYVRLMNAYGPSECSVITTVQSSSETFLTEPANIGQPVGGVTWAVNPDNHNKLTPIGAVGELLVEGPIVGRGYVNQPEKMAASFIEPPIWLQMIRKGPSGLLYRTGDLIRLLPDGSSVYVGRKDRQVKLHGQRIELAEVESHVQRCFPGFPETFVEIAASQQGENRYLVAFVLLQSTTKMTEFNVAINAAKEQLKAEVPAFLVPTAILPLRHVPLMASGKVDRRQLQQEACKALHLQMHGTDGALEHVPASSLSSREQRLRLLWAKVLRRPPESIGPGDHFFRLGGDSIGVMKLASMASQEGLDLTVSGIFLHPGLRELAQIEPQHSSHVFAKSSTAGSGDDFPPLDLIPPEHRSEAQTKAVDQCCIPINHIEDIYPCTAMQTSLVTMTAERVGAYIAQHRFRVPSHIDLDRLRVAWETVVAAHPILRTRVIQTERLGCLQVVIRDEKPLWRVWDRLPEGEAQPDLVFGHRLIQFDLATLPLTGPEYGGSELVLNMHHAVYDASSLARLVTCVQDAYYSPGRQLPAPARFQAFVQYSNAQLETALERWRAEFQDLSVESFPSLPSESYRPYALGSMERNVQTGSLKDSSVTRGPATWLSWAIVQSQYQGSSEAVFGIVSAGRGASVPGIDTMSGPTIATIPLRVKLPPSNMVTQSLDRLQSWSAQMIPFEQVGLQHISKLGPEALKATSFQTLLVVESSEAHISLSSDVLQLIATTADDGAFSTYALQLVCTLEPERVTIHATFDEQVVPRWQMEHIVDQFSSILQLVHQQPQRLLRDMPALNPRMTEQLRTWNADASPPLPATVSDMIDQQCNIQSFAPAVSARDGDFTYQDLDAWSNILATQLVSHGIGPAAVIPIYLERSRWTIVAILAVLRAGGAFVLLETAYPTSRMKAICDDIQAPFVITSPNTVSAAHDLSRTVIVVGPDMRLASPVEGTECLFSAANPGDALYVMFTSGSTGKSKGVVIENGAFITMAVAYSRQVGLDHTSRMLQFASYAFDVSIMEMLGTLIIGGCVCVLSDAERKEALPEAVARMKPSHAIFTPSMLRELAPSSLSSVRTIILTGEPARTSDILQWAAKVHLINSYGPAECTVFFTTQPSIGQETQATNIGRCISGNAWVSHPQNPQRPVPIGAVGELLLQGPLVGRGYLRNPDATAVSFIPCPKWIQPLTAYSDTHLARVYRTGDLVHYEADGSFIFVGRRNSQVKLRGQRFDLREVEESIQQHFPGVLKDVVAEVVPQSELSKTPWLVAFLVPDEQATAITPSQTSSAPLAIETPAPPGWEDQVATLESSLRDILPSYMVPSAFIPLGQMPQTVGGKVDRRRLREAIASVPRHQLYHSTPADTKKSTMTTKAELTLQNIWAQALGIPPAQIGPDESFFRLGGDSISALQATWQARANGIVHSVSDIIRWKSIREVAGRFAAAPKPQLVVPSRANIEGSSTVYPCSPTQRAILLNQMQDPTSYIPHWVWRVDPLSSDEAGSRIDVARLKAAWCQVVERHPALRVIFRPDPSHKDYFEQVLHRHIEPRIVELEEPVKEVADAHPNVTRSGQIPHHLLVYRTADGRVMCRLDINHAVVDAVSVSVIERDFCRAYDGSLRRSHGDAYQNYLSLVWQQPLEPARAYWASYLENLSPTQLPASRVSPEENDAPQRIDLSLGHSGSEIDFFCHSTDWTMSNFVYFAWALAVSSFTGASDICFGTLTSGRHFPVSHLEDAVGPFSNMSITRVRLVPQMSLDQVATGLQEHYGHVLSFQAFPLVEIARAAGVTMNEVASTAVNVQYTLPTDDSGEGDTALRLTTIAGEDPTMHAVVLSVLLARDGELRAVLSYRPSRISAQLASQLVEYFDLAISMVLQNPSSTVSDIHLLSMADQQRLRLWNPPLPSGPRVCIHHAVQQRSNDQPNRVAVTGWDGDLSYSELNRMSSQLAVALMVRGSGVGQFIPVCFEKSRWAVVAFLAVLKAGAAIVPLDPSHPQERLQDICRRTHSTRVICSAAQESLCRSLCEEVLVLRDHLFAPGAYDAASFTPPDVDPDQVAYVIFTSGSTGTPKGAMISHSSFTYAAETHIESLSIDHTSRILQFSSYSFDVSIMDILTTLIAGASVCVISELQRHEMLLHGICPYSVTHATLTPSVACTLDANRGSWTKHLILIGEPVSSSHVAQWQGVCNLMNSYGPTECSVMNTVRKGLSIEDDPRNIGWPLGIHCWVVDAENHHKLLPVGAVGELIMSGPAVGQGYLQQSEKTAEVFIDQPKWLQHIYPPASSPSWRMYKTGDLVRYEIEDGSLRFEGRKDRQVKIHGQRVELEEIECHIRRCFPGAKEVIVEQVVIPGDGSLGPSSAASSLRLVACIQQMEESTETRGASEDESNCRPEDLFRPPSRDFHANAVAALARVRKALPMYMAPDICLPLVLVPRTQAGKTDRRRLRDGILSIGPKICSSYTAGQQSTQLMMTETEMKLHSILARLLGRLPEAIGTEDSFFHLGGDSIIAMKLAAEARAYGLEISPQDLLSHPSIRQWARIIDDAGTASKFNQKQYEPLSLIREVDKEAIFTSYFNGDRPFTRGNVADMFPILASQEYYVTRTSLCSFAFVFRTALDIERLRRACAHVLTQYSILRATFVGVNNRIFQVLLNQVELLFDQVEHQDPEAYMTQLSQKKVHPSHDLGSIPVHFTVVTSSVGPDWVFILDISHAQYDGSCIRILWEAISAAYDGRDLPKAGEFATLVHHRLANDHSDSFAFWRQHLRDASHVSLNPLQLVDELGSLETDLPTNVVTLEISRPTLLPGITLANLVKGALAWVLFKRTLESEIVLGQVAHGRGASLPDIDKVFGPCVSFLPLRVNINPSWKVMDFLRYVQAQQLATIPHDSVMFPDIVSRCTSWPENAQFGFVTHHQANVSDAWQIGGIVSSSSAGWGNIKATPGQVGVFSIEDKARLQIMITSSGQVLAMDAIEHLADELCETMVTFLDSLNAPLASLKQS